MLLLDQDTPEEVLAERLGAILQPLSPPKDPDLYVASQQGLAIDTGPGLTRLQNLVAQYQPLLVILETIDTITSGGFNENRAQDVGHLFHSLSRIKAQHPCSLAISHHFGKKGQKGDPMTWIRGSSALPARADVGYALQRLSVGSQFLIQPMAQRWYCFRAKSCKRFGVGGGGGE